MQIWLYSLYCTNYMLVLPVYGNVLLCGAPAARGCILHVRPRLWRLVNGVQVIYKHPLPLCLREDIYFIARPVFISGSGIWADRLIPLTVLSRQ